MSPSSTSLASALAAVDEHAFVRRADGSQITQSSSQRVIAELLHRLEVKPGMRVLDIGTGSAYATALAAHLVGDNGHVFSVDVIADLVDRARTLLPEHGFANTTVLCADGAHGVPQYGPFDRIIAWATAPHLPAAWITQLTPDGTIIAPLALAPISKSGIGTRIRLNDDAAPYVDQLFPARFVELHGHELRQWLAPPYGADVLHHDEEQRPWWLSASWLRSPHEYLAGRLLLNDLMATSKTITGPLESGEDASTFRTWLLATHPHGLTTAALGNPEWRIGHTQDTSVALTDIRTATETIITGSLESAETLTRWVHNWRRAGRPDLNNLQPRLTAFHDGWTLHADTNKPG